MKIKQTLIRALERRTTAETAVVVIVMLIVVLIMHFCTSPERWIRI